MRIKSKTQFQNNNQAVRQETVNLENSATINRSVTTYIIRAFHDNKYEVQLNARNRTWCLSMMPRF